MQKMAKYALTNYIPLGAPATRRPSAQAEPALRVSLGFCPRWFARRIPVDFGRRWHEQPEYRYDALLRMKRLAHECFPDVPEFWPCEIAPGVEQGCATLSGTFGIKVIARFYGQHLMYSTDDWPDSRTRLSPAEIASMPPFDLDNHPAMAELDDQMTALRAIFGVVEGYLNYQGVLNTAFSLCGSDIFMAMLDDPPCARAAFAHIADTMRRVAERVQARQRESGFDIDLLSVSNCTINLISPSQYEDFLLSLDDQLSRGFSRFGVHTCNWNVTPYLSALRKIERVGYLDMGMNSDMRRARAMFPDARRAVMYTPLWVEQKKEAEMRADVERIYGELGPCDIVLADVSDTTCDERVRLFLRIADEVGRNGEVQA